jgi:hypothetical protein
MLYSIVTDESTDVKGLFVFEVLLRTLNQWRSFLEPVAMRGRTGADDFVLTW